MQIRLATNKVYVAMRREKLGISDVNPKSEAGQEELARFRARFTYKEAQKFYVAVTREHDAIAEEMGLHYRILRQYVNDEEGEEESSTEEVDGPDGVKDEGEELGAAEEGYQVDAKGRDGESEAEEENSEKENSEEGVAEEGW